MLKMATQRRITNHDDQANEIHLSAILTQLYSRIVDKRKEDRYIWMFHDEQEIWRKTNLPKFLDIVKQEYPNLDENSYLYLEQKLQKDINRTCFNDFGVTPLQVDEYKREERRKNPLPDWYRIHRTIDEYKTYFHQKSYERMLEDAEYLLERSVNKIQEYTKTEDDPAKIVAFQEIVIRNFLWAVTSSSHEYRLGDDVVIEVKEELTKRIRTRL